MTTIPSDLAVPRSRMPAAGRILLALLERLQLGTLELTTPDGVTRHFGHGGPVAGGTSVSAVLHIDDWKVAADVLKGGDVAFAECYMQGRVATPDLVALLTVLAANQSALDRAFYGAGVMRVLLRLKHLLRTNTRRQARRNIVAHYDLGNTFYGQWLDATMTYSSALFDGDFSLPLHAAQQAKYDRMLSELDVAPGARILEIGCGWGGFAETAARAGHHVTGISLSDAQTTYARQRLAAAGLAGRSHLELRDYRDLRGTFDAIASIEMIEAVGERYWPTYFSTVRNALVPGGRACIQAITITDDRFPRYRTQSDFIQQYIFPGGMLPAPARLMSHAQKAGLELVTCHAFGLDYAETLRRWLASFDHAAPVIRTLGFDDTFIRCWRFYLAYCAAGFDTRTTDVAQYTFVRN